MELKDDFQVIDCQDCPFYHATCIFDSNGLFNGFSFVCNIFAVNNNDSKCLRISSPKYYNENQKYLAREQRSMH